MNSLRLLLDQMLDVDVASALRQLGHDVVSASELGLATADDSEILARAILDDRTLLTLDEHFGDWTVLPLSEHPGVVRIKANPTNTGNVLALLLPFVLRHSMASLRNRLVIVRPSGVRSIWTAQGTPPEGM